MTFVAISGRRCEDPVTIVRAQQHRGRIRLDWVRDDGNHPRRAGGRSGRSQPPPRQPRHCASRFSTATAASSRCSASASTGSAGSTACSPAPVPPEAIVSMRLAALVVDLAVLGPQAWEWLERLCGALPELGDRRLHRPLDRRPARARAAPRRRRLDHQALPPRGGDRARPKRRAPPPPARRPRRGQAGDAGEVEIRSDRFQAFVRGPSIDLTRREFELIELLAAADGRVLEREVIYSAAVGLRDGPRRPLRRRVRAQAAPEARARPRPSGATSTPTSASATASPPNPRTARPRGRDCRARARRPDPTPERPRADVDGSSRTGSRRWPA